MKFYSQITRELYNSLLEDKIIYPKFGLSCRAANNYAEQKVIEYLKRPVFFGWEDIGNKLESFKGDKILYSNSSESDFVLLEIETNDFVRTNYYNYSDLIWVYDCLEDNEINNINKINEIIQSEFGKSKNLKELIKDVFIVDEENLVQILYFKLDVNEIVSVKNIDNIII